MLLKGNLRNNHIIRFGIGGFLTSMLLSGCQFYQHSYELENKETKLAHDAVAKNEFVLSDNQDLVGVVVSIDTWENDTLPDIARHFGLGYNDITIANPHLDPWLPKSKSRVILPLRFIIPDVERQGLILNLASMRLFYFPKQLPDRLITYPIGIGRNGWRTPTGSTTIIAKKKNPVWHVPKSILNEHARKGDPLPRTVPAGPENPLGDYALRLGFPRYLIHGTNKPYGVGMQISHGCVRLYPENIAALFQQIPVGTTVNIVDQPFLLGWNKGMLFLEAHKPFQQVNSIKLKLFDKLKTISQQQQIMIDWPKVEQILNAANGIPLPILAYSADYASLLRSAPNITHPEQFLKQPVVKPLSRQDWTIRVGTFKDADTAQKLVAILNHQGPPIPARRIQKAGLYRVVAGPFHSEKEVQSVIVKIKNEFQLNGMAQPPMVTEYTQ